MTTTDELPDILFDSYDRSRPTPGGKILLKLRQALRDDPSHEPAQPNPKKIPQVSLRDWTATIGAARPNERKLLLQAVAKKYFRIT